MFLPGQVSEAADLNTIIYNRALSYNGDPETSAWICQAIMYASSVYNVDPLLVTAVMESESRFNVNVGHSSAGAVGLMQLMPDTAAMIGVNPYDPLENIIGGTSYLRTMLDDFAGWGQYQVSYAVCAYNAGWKAVKDANGCPYWETYDYAVEISQSYNEMLQLYQYG